MSDDELVAYAVRVSAQWRRHSGVAMGTALILFIPFGLSLVAGAIGIPLQLIAGLILLVLVAFVPAFVRSWRSDVSRMESVVELMRRGLAMPTGVAPVRLSALNFTRRTVVPMTILYVCAFGIIAGVGVVVSDVVSNSVPLIQALMALLVVVLACVVWDMVILFQSVRGSSPDDRTGPA